MLRHEKPVVNIDELPIVAAAENVEDCLEKQIG